MAKITLKGIVKRITPVETVGNNGTKKQSVILFEPGWVDEFGDKRGRDNEWCLDLINDQITTLNLSTSLHEKKVIVEAYLNSNPIQSKVDGSTIHIINASLKSINIFDPDQRPSAPTANKTNW